MVSRTIAWWIYQNNFIDIDSARYLNKMKKKIGARPGRKRITEKHVESQNKALLIFHRRCELPIFKCQYDFCRVSAEVILNFTLQFTRFNNFTPNYEIYRITIVFLFYYIPNHNKKCEHHDFPFMVYTRYWVPIWGISGE